MSILQVTSFGNERFVMVPAAERVNVLTSWRTRLDVGLPKYEPKVPLSVGNPVPPNDVGYLRSSMHACHSTRSLRLSNTNLLSAPFVRTSFGARSFSAAAPKIWNSPCISP